MSHQINLFNPDFCIRRQPFSASMMLQGLVLLTTVALLYYAYVHYQLSDQQVHVLAMEKRLVAEQNQLTQVIAEYGQPASNTLLEIQVERLEERLSAKQVVVKMLQEEALGNSHGFSKYMRAFARQLLNGLWLTGFTISNTEMVLMGRMVQADLMPAYLQRLKQESVMQGRAFSTLQIEMPEPEIGQSEESNSSALGYLKFSLGSSGIGQAE